MISIKQTREKRTCFTRVFLTRKRVVNFPQTRVDMHNMVGGSFDVSHEPHGSQAHGRIPYWVCLGPFWAMLGHFGLCWARVGTILGLSWAILGYVGTFWAMLEPYWAHLGPFWALFGSVSAFVLDSGISASLTFRPCKAYAKKTKIQGKNTICIPQWISTTKCYDLGPGK